MPVPSRVREDARAAEEQMAQIRVQNGVDPAPPAAPNAPVSLDNRGFESPHPNAINERPAVPPVQEIPVSGDEPPNEEPGAKPVDARQVADLQQKLDTAQGLAAKRQNELNQVTQRVGQLEAYIDILSRAAEATPPAAAPAPAATALDLVSDAEKKEFGDDLIDVIKRASREEWRPVLDQVFARLGKIDLNLSAMQGTVQSTAKSVVSADEQRYNAAMDRLVKDDKGESDWQAINLSHERGDNRFVDWLQKIGEDSDEPRLNVIQRAYGRRDAEACARLINKFKAEVGLPDGTAAPATEAPQPVASNPAQALISPSPVGTTGPGRPRNSARTYTMVEISKAYDDYTRGKYRGKDAEWVKLKAEFDKALREGRIVDK